MRNAAQRGPQIRPSSEYLSYEQDADGVTVQVLDRLTARTFEVPRST